jgi:hypothetical protein
MLLTIMIGTYHRALNELPSAGVILYWTPALGAALGVGVWQNKNPPIRVRGVFV